MIEEKYPECEICCEFRPEKKLDCCRQKICTVCHSKMEKCPFCNNNQHFEPNETTVIDINRYNRELPADAQIIIEHLIIIDKMFISFRILVLMSYMVGFFMHYIQNVSRPNQLQIIDITLSMIDMGIQLLTIGISIYHNNIGPIFIFYILTHTVLLFSLSLLYYIMYYMPLIYVILDILLVLSLALKYYCTTSIVV